MKKNVIKLNENTLRKIVAESVKKVLKENISSINTVEDLCMLVGCSINEQEEAQLKIEQMLMYLHKCGVINGFNEDKIDWLFSNEQSYNDLDKDEFNGDAPDEFNPPLPRRR